MLNKRVIEYGTKACSHCAAAKEYLTNHNIEFDFRDITVDLEAKKYLMDTLQIRSIPVIDIGGKLVVGFDPEKIKKALQ